MASVQENLIKKRMWEALTQSSAIAMVLARPKGEMLKMGTLTATGFQSLIAVIREIWSKGMGQTPDNYDILELDERKVLLFTRRTLSEVDLVGLVFPSEISFVNVHEDMDRVLKFLGDIDFTPGEDPPLEQSLQLPKQPPPKPEEPSLDWHHPIGWLSEFESDGLTEEDVVSQESEQQPIPEEVPPKHDPQRLVREPESGSSSEKKHWQPLDTLLSTTHQESTTLDSEAVNQIDHLASWIVQDDLPSSENKEIESLAGELSGGEERDLHHHDPQPSLVKDQNSEDWLTELMKSISILTEDPSLAETVFDTTFYLVPRLDTCYLLGELAQHLREWFPALCEIYGWELSLLSLRPDYIKWTLVDFPECLKMDMLAAVRKWTSERIFSAFPEMQIGNRSDDFWSPGYLVDTQNREFPTQVLVSHISRERVITERRQ